MSLPVKLPSIYPDFNNSEEQPFQTIPPPEKDDEEIIEKPTKQNQPVFQNEESEESINDEGDTSYSSIITEENVTEVEDQDVIDALQIGANPKISREPNKNKMGNRSLRIIKQITESFETPDGVDHFEEEMKRVDESRRYVVKQNPKLNKIFGDNQDITLDQKDVINIMLQTSGLSEISKQTGIIMNSICKVFLSEIVAEAQKVRDIDGRNDTDPLIPQEVQIAYRRLLDRGSIPDINKTPYFCDN